MTEEDEDDEDDIRFVTLESGFENKETVNYKSAMPSIYENAESAVCFGKILGLTSEYPATEIPIKILLPQSRVRSPLFKHLR